MKRLFFSLLLALAMLAAMPRQAQAQRRFYGRRGYYRPYPRRYYGPRFYHAAPYRFYGGRYYYRPRPYPYPYYYRPRYYRRPAVIIRP